MVVVVGALGDLYGDVERRYTQSPAAVQGVQRKCRLKPDSEIHPVHSWFFKRHIGKHQTAHISQAFAIKTKLTGIEAHTRPGKVVSLPAI